MYMLFTDKQEKELVEMMGLPPRARETMLEITQYANDNGFTYAQVATKLCRMRSESRENPAKYQVKEEMTVRLPIVDMVKRNVVIPKGSPVLITIEDGNTVINF
jgi:hypothetical protein